MVSTAKIKSVDFYRFLLRFSDFVFCFLFGLLYKLDFNFYCRKIPRDLTEASLSGAGLSIVAALSMMFLFGMVRTKNALPSYLFKL